MQKECFIVKELRSNSKENIREKVCKGLAAIHVHNGNFFCVLHYPDDKKHLVTDFDLVIKERLDNQENAFDYVYFSGEWNFVKHRFNEFPSFLNAIFAENVDFSEVIFSQGAGFKGTIFKGDTDFYLSIFKGITIFNYAIFENQVSFSSSVFKRDVHFKGTKFKEYGYFNRVKFKRNVEFINAEFTLRATFYNTHFKDGADFEQAKFLSESSFASAVFFDTTHFIHTEFKLKAEFNEATFKKSVSFRDTTFFEKVEFEGTVFEDYCFFKSTVFHEALFCGSVFDEHSEVTFENVVFVNLNFSNCKIKNIFTIEENKPIPFFDKRQIIFRDSLIKNYELISFRTIKLKPSWFININSKEINFIDVDWNCLNSLTTHRLVIKELNQLNNISNSKQLFKIACRQLAENAENNNRFEEASKFRGMAFETERLERKKSIFDWWGKQYTCSEVVPSFGDHLKLIPHDFLHFAYRFTSLYGESSIRAFCVLTGIILVAAFLYWSPLSQFPDKESFRNLGLLESIFYSLRVMVLQRPEPFPANTFGKAVLALESVIAPVQLALLALAIRRKFMR